MVVQRTTCRLIKIPKNRYHVYVCLWAGEQDKTVESKSLLLQCVAVCCNVLQCVAVCGKDKIVESKSLVLQCVAVCCSVLQWQDCWEHESCLAACCSVLQCVAVCCGDKTFESKSLVLQETLESQVWGRYPEVFLLGRVKSGETLGNGCSSTKSLLGSWNVERVVKLGVKIFPNSQFLLNTISLTERSNRQPGSTA